MENKEYQSIKKMKEEIINSSKKYRKLNKSMLDYFLSRNKVQEAFENEYKKVAFLYPKLQKDLVNFIDSFFSLKQVKELDEFQHSILFFTVITKILKPEELLRLLSNYNIDYETKITKNTNDEEKLSIIFGQMCIEYSNEDKFRSVKKHNTFKDYDEILKINLKDYAFCASVQKIYSALERKNFKGQKSHYQKIVDNVNKIEY